MKINKNGLWFKLHKLVGTRCYWALREGDRVSLCTYFWGGLGAMVALVMASVVASLLLWLGFSILVLLTGPYTGWWGYETMMLVAVPMTLALLFFTVVTSPFWGLPVSPDWINKPLAKLFKRTVPETPKPVNVVKEYYKAHKSKFCPMIELEDDNNE